MDSRYYYPNKLVEARKLLGKSQAEIAQILNVDRQTVYRMETGSNVSYELLVQLCIFYRIPMTNVVVAVPDLGQAATVA